MLEHVKLRLRARLVEVERGRRPGLKFQGTAIRPASAGPLLCQEVAYQNPNLRCYKK